MSEFYDIFWFIVRRFYLIMLTWFYMSLNYKSKIYSKCKRYYNLSIIRLLYRNKNCKRKILIKMSKSQIYTKN